MSQRRFDGSRMLGFAGSVLLAAGGAGCGALPVDDPFAGWPVVAELRGAPDGAVALACAGLTLLVVAWQRLRPAPPRSGPAAGPVAVRGRTRDLLITFAWWAAPLAVAPPLFSRDVYSYLAQGVMVLHGINPYHGGPALLGGPLDWNIPPIWQFTPAPYGPVFIGAATTVMRLAGEHTVPGVLGMRAVALGGLALVARHGPRVARRFGVDAAQALWLALLNPLMLVHLVGGAHNDALMVGLTVLGFSLLTAGRAAAGVVAVTLAMLVKLPAGLALVFLLPLVTPAAPGAAGPGRYRRWPIYRNRHPPKARHIGHRRSVDGPRGATGSTRGGQRWAVAMAAVRTAGLATVTVVLVTLIVGLGYGWVAALHTPTRARNGLSLSTDAGLLVGYPARALGLATVQQAIDACRAVGMAAALALVVGALARVRRLGPVYALGIALTAVVLLAPVVHPWYLLWGFVPLALSTPAGPARRFVVMVSAGGAFALLPDGERRPGEVLAGAVGVAVALAVLRLPGLRRSGGPDRQVVQGEPVPVDAEPADDPARHGRHDRMVPELLPGMDVGDVHLDQRTGEQGAGVPQRVRIV
jgi:alpha-1,6-mannosyltransferase